MIDINVSLNKENIDDNFIIMPDDDFDMHHAADHLEEPSTCGKTGKTGINHLFNKF